ncbi:MAG: cobalt ECF transporter T component CbiQ, partial [Dechloromonas sp.]|nr:cobalt ECF transporter T component CbiQ [Dechloromonas sp.]
MAMHLEHAAFVSRWRPVSPVAKGLFALAGVVAAFAAPTPGGALAVAGLLVAVTCLAAGVPIPTYLRAAAAPLLFLALSSLSLALSLGSVDGGGLTLTRAPDAGAQLGRVGSRSLAALAALLLLVLTTPLPDLIGLLRRLKTPALL